MLVDGPEANNLLDLPLPVPRVQRSVSQRDKMACDMRASAPRIVSGQDLAKLDCSKW